MIHLKGKKGRRVPLILELKTKLALQLIYDTRQQFVILDDNQFFFANSAEGYLKLWACTKYVCFAGRSPSVKRR